MLVKTDELEDWRSPVRPLKAGAFQKILNNFQYTSRYIIMYINHWLFHNWAISTTKTVSLNLTYLFNVKHITMTIRIYTFFWKIFYIFLNTNNKIIIQHIYPPSLRGLYATFKHHTILKNDIYICYFIYILILFILLLLLLLLLFHWLPNHLTS